MIFSYLTKRLRRHPAEAVVSALLVLVVIVLLLGLHSYRGDLLAEMDEAYETIKIRCRVTSADNSHDYSLRISDDYVAMLTEEGGILYPYVKDVYLLESYLSASVLPDDTLPERYSAARGTNVELHMTNDPESYTVKEGAEFLFRDGYSIADFAGKEPVCVISENLEELVSEDGTILLRMYQGGVAMRMKVIGIYGDEIPTVFGAWEPLKALLAEVGLSPDVTSMAFTISDNRQLDFAKMLLSDYYIPASKLNNDSARLGLVVDDALFVDTITVLERGLALLDVVQILVYILSVGVSFLVSYLNIRTRKTELAVMRSLGTRSIALYLEVLAEHGLFFLFGTVAATVGVLPFGIRPGVDHMKVVGIFMLCYLLGVVIAVAQATSGKLMQTLKGKE